VIFPALSENRKCRVDDAAGKVALQMVHGVVMLGVDLRRGDEGGRVRVLGG